jgi:hypothetical protein
MLRQTELLLSSIYRRLCSNILLSLKIILPTYLQVRPFARCSRPKKLEKLFVALIVYEYYKISNWAEIMKHALRLLQGWSEVKLFRVTNSLILDISP